MFNKKQTNMFSELKDSLEITGVLECWRIFNPGFLKGSGKTRAEILLKSESQ